jgi:hypothetical protein
LELGLSTSIFPTNHRQPFYLFFSLKWMPFVNFCFKISVFNFCFLLNGRMNNPWLKKSKKVQNKLITNKLNDEVNVDDHFLSPSFSLSEPYDSCAFFFLDNS